MTETEFKRESIAERSQRLYLQTLLWLLASGVSFATVVFLTVIGHEVVGFDEEWAVVVAMLVATFNNFLMCRYVVFGSFGQRFLKHFLLFVYSVAAFRFAEYGAFLVCHSLFGVPYQWALIAIQFASLILKFFVMRAWVFRAS